MKILIVTLVLSVSAFGVWADATVSTIRPAAGLTRGGEIVHIHGSNLRPTIVCVSPVGCTMIVTFGGVAGTILGGSTIEEIVVIAPPHAAGPVDVEVTVPGQGVVTIPSGYIYQEPGGNERVRLLVPIAISAPGALNSNWKSDVLLNNGNAEPLLLDGPFIQGIIAVFIEPFSTVAITQAFTLAPGNPGAFIYATRALVDNVLVSVRVHDTSRDADSWGTDIPAVPEAQFRRSILLVGVPNDARFRTMLRIYGYSAADGAVLVTLRDDATGELLVTRTVQLISGTRDDGNAPLVPGYGQLSLEGILAPFATAHPQIRVEIAPTGPLDPPMWGFVAVTNNVTQQVTTITPAIVPGAVAIPTPSSLTLGHWGGANACLDVTASQVTTTFHCNGGSFPVPLVGFDGRFEVDGTFQSLSPLPGPVVPAHYSGVLQGNSLTVAVRVGSISVPGINVQLGFPGQCNSGSSGCPISDDPLRGGH